MAMLVGNSQNSGGSGRDSGRDLVSVDAFLGPLAQNLGISVSELANLIGSPLRGDEIGVIAELYFVNNSVALTNLGEVAKRGREVWGKDYLKFIAWLHAPVRALKDEKPISLLKTPQGIEKVLEIIGRIEHGIHS